MRLMEEIWKGAQGVGARYTVLVGGGGYFEGVKRVGDLSSQKIVLYFSGCALTVEGVGLAIQKYCDGDVRISGKIRLIGLLDGKDGGQGRA